MKYIFLLLCLWTIAAHGQSSVRDTVFYDDMWRKCTHEDYSFYRLITLHKGEYIVTDHYKNGIVQMKGIYLSLDPEVKNGPFTYYFPSGQVESERKWHNNLREGTFKYYDDKTGLLKRTEQYKDNLKDGKFVKYDDNGNVKSTSVYEHGVLIKGTPEPSGRSTYGILSSQDIISKLGNAQMPDTHTNEILKRNFDKIVPDSLKKTQCEVSVDYDFNAEGAPENFRYDSSAADEPHIRVVIQTIRETYQSNSSHKSTGTTKVGGGLTVKFPELSTTTNFNMNMGGKSSPSGTTGSSSAFAGSFFDMFAKNNHIDSLRRYIKENYAKTHMAGDTAIIPETVRVKFITDEQGHFPEIISSSGNNQDLVDFAIKMVKGYPDWRSLFVANRIQVHTLTVNFPNIGVHTQEGLDK